MENHIGNMIRQRVAEMPGMTSKLLAEKLGVHEQTIYDIYKRPSINTDILLKICRILEVPVTYFLGNLEAPSENGDAGISSPSNNSNKAEDLQASENKAKSKTQVNYTFGKKQELPFSYTTTSVLESQTNLQESSSTNSTKESPSNTKTSTGTSSSFPPHVQFPQQPATTSPLANISQSIREIRDMQYKQELEHALEKIHLLEKQLADKDLIIQLLLEKIKLLLPNSEY
ncbi:MAG: helix-turn-helix transcriptional regulator [Bacteroidia bacterium]|nr:helix-turn-helix transcriptional regulator [Bacteroidia bacterium]MDW8157963.1 helix-turn-helix transcriptional regulator [Bacteroidia bacterium]